MTSDKAPKAAARRRMAETGEPYSVAMRAVRAAHRGSATIAVRYQLRRTFELEIDRDTWTSADNHTRARLIARSGRPAGSAAQEPALADLIEQDLSSPGADCLTVTPTADLDGQYLADDAASEDITAAQNQADRAQEQADRAQDQADRAQEQADEERALADEAQDLIDAAKEDGDTEARRRAYVDRAGAEREAELAEREAKRLQVHADREQERADREQERADLEQEHADDIASRCT